MQRGRHLRVVENECSLLTGVDQVLEAEPLGQLDLGVGVGGGPLEVLAPERRLGLLDLLPRQPAAPGQGLVEAQQVVEQHAQLQLEAVEGAAPEERHEEPQRLHEVRRDRNSVSRSRRSMRTRPKSPISR